MRVLRRGCLVTFVILWAFVGAVGCLTEMYATPNHGGTHEHHSSAR
jgi:hypothetical protein